MLNFRHFIICRFALECECWKQSEVSGDIQNLIDHIVKNGLGLSMKKLDPKTNKTPSDCVVIENEKYFIFGYEYWFVVK